MAWLCPCQGCKKAVKQEQERILKLLDEIDLNASHQINALGFKLLAIDIIKNNK
ncbi:MAG: hypothetical protein RLZZ195_935 [Pseudomonadota bacterium]|jgi:coenzyme F420-reducing hydrogenase gamma subunit